MNSCTITQNFGNIILQYILILTKCEKLHTKLEGLYAKTDNTKLRINNKIFKINDALNKLFVELLNYQWLIELFGIATF